MSLPRSVSSPASGRSRPLRAPSPSDRGAGGRAARAQATESDVEVVEARIARDTERLRAPSSAKDAAFEHELVALRKRHRPRGDRAHRDGDVRGERAARAAETSPSSTHRIAEARTARDAALGGIEASAHRPPPTARDRREGSGRPARALREAARRYGAGASLLQRRLARERCRAELPGDGRRARRVAPDDVILCPDRRGPRADRGVGAVSERELTSKPRGSRGNPGVAGRGIARRSTPRRGRCWPRWACTAASPPTTSPSTAG